MQNMRIMPLLFLFFLSQLHAKTNNSICQSIPSFKAIVQSINSPKFIATYTIETAYNKHTLEYFRNGNIIAFTYPNQNITEVYTKQNNGSVYLIKAFDRYKRAIEYDPIDMQTEGVSIDWQNDSNLPTPNTLNLLGYYKPCADKQGFKHYLRRNEHSYIEMIWYEPKQLLVYLEIYNYKKLQYRYTLNTLKQVDNRIQRIKAYESTDFADIGDNEHDPFLVKLIDLGFVSHHEVNVLNTNGQLMKIEHSSHHH